MNWSGSEENSAKKTLLGSLSTDTHSAYPEKVVVPPCRNQSGYVNWISALQNFIDSAASACMQYPDVGNADSSEDLGQPGRNLHEAEGQTGQPRLLICYHLCSMSVPGYPVSLGIVADLRMSKCNKNHSK